MATPTDATRPNPDAAFVETRSGGSLRRLHFRDPRPPPILIAHLERVLMAVLRASIVEDRLIARAQVRITGANHHITLHHHTAWPGEDGYIFEVDSTWGHLPEASHLYFQNNAHSWFKLWTQDLLPASPAQDSDGSPELRQQRIHAVLARDLQLADIPNVQDEILSSLRHGASYVTSHQEGGTRIRWNGRGFVRTDFGETQKTEEFTDPTVFLDFLRRFLHHEISRHCHPDPIPETDAWRLILRKLHADG